MADSDPGPGDTSMMRHDGRTHFDFVPATTRPGISTMSTRYTTNFRRPDPRRRLHAPLSRYPARRGSLLWQGGYPRSHPTYLQLLHRTHPGHPKPREARARHPALQGTTFSRAALLATGHKCRITLAHGNMAIYLKRYLSPLHPGRRNSIFVFQAATPEVREARKVQSVQ